MNDAEQVSTFLAEYIEPVTVLGVPDTELDEEGLRRALRCASRAMERERERHRHTLDMLGQRM